MRRGMRVVGCRLSVVGGEERMRDAGCGMRDAGCGMRDAGCGMRDAGCGMRVVGGGLSVVCGEEGLWVVGCGLWVVGCGLWVVGCRWCVVKKGCGLWAERWDLTGVEPGAYRPQKIWQDHQSQVRHLPFYRPGFMRSVRKRRFLVSRLFLLFGLIAVLPRVPYFHARAQADALVAKSRQPLRFYSSRRCFVQSITGQRGPCWDFAHSPMTLGLVP